MVLTVNNMDSKSSFKTNYIDKYKVESICVPSENGGKKFDKALKNQMSGGPCYLIKPDKTFKEGTEKDIKAAGIKPHQCSTDKLADLAVYTPKSKITCMLNSKALKLSISNPSTYNIKLYTTNGKNIFSKNDLFLSNGMVHLQFPHAINPNQVYCIEIQSDEWVYTQKISIYK